MNLTYLGAFLSKLVIFLLYFLKILSIIYLFIIVRAAIPRYRYDQLMRMG